MFFSKGAQKWLTEYTTNNFYKENVSTKIWKDALTEEFKLIALQNCAFDIRQKNNNQGTHSQFRLVNIPI